MTSLTKAFPDAKVVDGVNQSSEEIQAELDKCVTGGNRITILTLPPKGSANDIGVKEWDQVILTKEWQERAKKANIPYEMEWFIVSNINKDGEGKPVSYRLMGSTTGGWNGIDWNQPNVISRIIGNMMT